MPSSSQARKFLSLITKSKGVLIMQYKFTHKENNIGVSRAINIVIKKVLKENNVVKIKFHEANHLDKKVVGIDY
jgi:hypothetical protein